MVLPFWRTPVAVDTSKVWLERCKTEDRDEGEVSADIVLLDVVVATEDDWPWADMPKPIAMKSPTPCVVVEPEESVVALDMPE